MAWCDWQEEREEEREVQEMLESSYSHGRKIRYQKSVKRVRGYINEQAPKPKKKKNERKVNVKKGRKVGRVLVRRK